MRILVVGAGATGGFYGGKLVQASQDVTFLVREHRAKQIREHGLELVTPEGSVTLYPGTITAAELRKGQQAFDLILLTPKAYQLEQAMEDVAPAVGPDTVLLPILNGLRHLKMLDDRFGEQHVLGGSVRIVADLDLQGRVHQMTPMDDLSYGERSGEVTPRSRAVDAVMRGAGFDARLEPDIMATLWEKWWILASMGAICILSRGTIGEVAAAPGGKEFVHNVLRECTAIVTANGYPPNATTAAKHLQRMTESGSSLTSSMYRDMIKGAPVEADHILGDLLARANSRETPLLSAAYLQLKVYEAGRQKA